MGLSGGDHSERINSSHSIIQEFAHFACSDWMGLYWMGLSGGDQTCQNNFPPSKIIVSPAKIIFQPAKLIKKYIQTDRHTLQHDIYHHHHLHPQPPHVILIVIIIQAFLAIHIVDSTTLLVYIWAICTIHRPRIVIYPCKHEITITIRGSNVIV